MLLAGAARCLPAASAGFSTAADLDLAICLQANGRTVRSLAYVLSMYPGVKMYFVAPDEVRCNGFAGDACIHAMRGMAAGALGVICPTVQAACCQTPVGHLACFAARSAA